MDESRIGFCLCVITFTAFSHAVNGGHISCDPAEEGTVYKTHFFLNPDPPSSDIVLVDTHHGRNAVCTGLINCSNELPLHFNTTLSKINGSFVITIIAFNISRISLPHDDAFYFMVSYSRYLDEVQFTCTPKVFAKPKVLNCKRIIYEEGLQLTCYAERVFPKGKCHAVFHLNNKSTYGTITSEKNQELLGIPIFFSTRCTVILPKANLTPGNIDVNITVYPAVNNNEMDIQFGSSLVEHFKIEYPSVTLVGCPQAVEEGNKITCVCVKKNTDNMTVDIHWYNISGNQLDNVQQEVLNIQARNFIQEFYCMATNVFGWKSQMSHYKPIIYYTASVKQLTLNGESREMIHVRHGSILSFRCEVDGNPSPTLKLHNGPVILKETWSMTPPFFLDWSYKMNCESYNEFTCSAVQLNKHSTKSIFVYTNCTTQLKNLSDKTLRLLKAHLNSQVSILIEIYGHPKPNFYRIAKSDTFEFNFNVVIDGNVHAYGYAISYHDDIQPFGTLNLTFKIVEKIDFTNYTLIIDNSVGTALNYTFTILEATTFLDMDNQPTNSGFVIVVIAGTILPLFFIITGLLFCWKKKGFEVNSAWQIKDISDLYEEINYEEIELNDLVNNVLAQNNEDFFKDNSDLIEGRNSYDSIEEAIIFERAHRNDDSNRDLIRNNQYDVLDSEVVCDYHSYNKIDIRTIEWNVDYITVIDEIGLDDNNFITIIGIKDNYQSTSAIREDVEKANEYISVIDVTYQGIND